MSQKEIFNFFNSNKCLVIIATFAYTFLYINYYVFLIVLISFTYSLHELSYLLNFRNVFSVNLDSIFHEFPDKGVSRMVQGQETLGAKLCGTTTPDPTLMKCFIKGSLLTIIHFRCEVAPSCCDTKFCLNCTNCG